MIDELIKFTAFLESALVSVDANDVKPETYSQLDQVSILPPFVILNGRIVLIKQRIMAPDKRKSPFHQEGSQAWGVNDLVFSAIIGPNQD